MPTINRSSPSSNMFTPVGDIATRRKYDRAGNLGLPTVVYNVTPYCCPAVLAQYNDTETLTYLDGPKTVPITIDGIVNDVPVFKAVTHRKTVRTCSPSTVYVEEWDQGSGDSRYRYTWNHNNDITPWLRCSTYDWLNPDGVYYASMAGTPASIASSMASTGAAIIKERLLNDHKLLGFKDAFNLLAFIGELRDVRRLPEILTKWTRSDKDISDKFLGMNFGVLPFASDLRSIADRVIKLGPSIDKWNDAASKGKIFNAHTIVPYTWPAGFVDVGDGWHEKSQSSSPGNIAVGVRLYPEWYNVTVKRRVTIKAHLYFHPHAVSHSVIPSLKRMIWGIDKPLTAAWNLIPFSFVADWFANIGDLIEEFEKSESLLKVQIVSAGYSVKVETVSSLRLGYTSNKNDDSHGCITLTDTYYTRQPLSAASIYSATKKYGSLEFSALTSDQSILGSALLHQFLRK